MAETINAQTRGMLIVFQIFQERITFEILWSVNKNDELFHNYNFSATTVQINDQVEQSEQISNNDYSILKDSKVGNILIFSLISLIVNFI